MRLQKVEAPEDWRTPFELDDDDMLDPDLPYHPEDWNNPISMIEPVHDGCKNSPCPVTACVGTTILYIITAPV